MKTRILNLEGALYDGEAKLVNVKTLSGEITILDHHRPIISALAQNAHIYLDDIEGKRHDFNVKGGFLNLDVKNELTVLVD